MPSPLDLHEYSTAFYDVESDFGCVDQYQVAVVESSKPASTEPVNV